MHVDADPMSGVVGDNGFRSGNLTNFGRDERAFAVTASGQKTATTGDEPGI